MPSTNFTLYIMIDVLFMALFLIYLVTVLSFKVAILNAAWEQEYGKPLTCTIWQKLKVLRTLWQER